MSQNIWYSIEANIANGVARSRNITLGVFPGGFPPCGLPLFPNFDVDMEQLVGNSSGITDQNKKLNEEWGTMVEFHDFFQMSCSFIHELINFNIMIHTNAVE